MTHEIALQLYTVREHLARDFEGVVRKVAEMGYAGVETAGFPEGVTPERAAALFRDLGLRVCSAHLPLAGAGNEAEVAETARALGVGIVVSGKGPDAFKDAETIKNTAAEFNAAAETLARHGLRLAIHNHWWEFLRVGDEPAYRLLLRELSDEVGFEIDTYWVKTGGCDPAAVMRELGGRVLLLHLKDGPCDKDRPMTPLGQGEMDFAAVLAEAGHVQWLIVEQDRGETDLLDAAAESFRFLQGLLARV